MNGRIIIRNLSKEFRIYNDGAKTFKEWALRLRSKKYQEFEALRDINLTIEPGESVAIVGVNGSGKSTLLKLISNIIYPTKGSVETEGKVAGLLELGAGFHPDFSGRENIYINASIFGLSRKQTDEILDDIIEFSGLGSFIDVPVRTYSSGMYLRLGFAVAVYVLADIYLIDEILAVGDGQFREKCYAKIEELFTNKMTVVLVSHDLEAVERLCKRVIWIKDHELYRDGDCQTVLMEYREFLANNG